jgi:hypothetical protein
MTPRSGEVHMEARMGQQPPLDRRGLVGGGVVDDHVHVQLGRHRAVDRGQELAELTDPVTAVGLVHDLAGRRVQGGEQAGRAMADVVVGAPLGQVASDRPPDGAASRSSQPGHIPIPMVAIRFQAPSYPVREG